MKSEEQVTTRRAFLRNTSRIAAASALVGIAIPNVHAAENNTIQVALIGCGGRGAGAAANALSVNNGQIRLVAMADVFENRLKASLGQLKKDFADKVDVSEDRQSIGFDGYKRAMDCLKAGDVVILAMRTYRMHGPIASFASGSKPQGIGELLYQIQRFHSFLWASGGCYSDFYIHSIDECCWMKNGWPVQAQASGGRHYRGNFVDQNFDNYSVEYTFADGTKLLLYGRCILGCYEQTKSYAHGSKGLASICDSRIFKGQNPSHADIVWRSLQPVNFYQYEWDDLIDAIRQDKPYNEAKRGAEASLVSSMGRMAAHTGQIVTFDQMLNHEHEFAPAVDQLTMDSLAPLLAGPDGTYSVPQPGVTTKREY